MSQISRYLNSFHQFYYEHHFVFSTLHDNLIWTNFFSIKKNFVLKFSLFLSIYYDENRCKKWIDYTYTEPIYVDNFKNLIALIFCSTILFFFSSQNTNSAKKESVVFINFYILEQIIEHEMYILLYTEYNVFYVSRSYFF